VSDGTLHDYDDTYLECRGLMHAWRHIGFFQDHSYVSRLAQCTRCHTRRIQTMNRSGEYISNPRYEYPDGYNHEYLERSEFRRETIRRAGSVFGSMDQLLNNVEGITVADRRAARKAAS
jgi:hypothetical protein